MLIIAGKAYLSPDQRAAYLDAFQEFVRQSRHEPGLLDFVIAADPIEPNRINIFERWATEAQMRAFQARANPPQLDIEITGDDDIQLYEISSVGPVFP